MLGLARRRRLLELAVQHNTILVEDDPYGDLYFGDAPPPSLLRTVALRALVCGRKRRIARADHYEGVRLLGYRFGTAFQTNRTTASAHRLDGAPQSLAGFPGVFL
jgi:hypothetical protein